MMTINLKILVSLLMFLLMNSISITAHADSSENDLKQERIEKLEEELKRLRNGAKAGEEKNKQEETSDLKPTKTLVLIKRFVSEKNPHSELLSKRKKGLKEYLKGANPDLDEEQINDIVATYEDKNLEDKTASATSEGSSTKTKALVGLDIDKKNTEGQKGFRGKLSKLTSNASNGKKAITPEITVLTETAINTVVSLTIKKGDTLSDIAIREYGDSRMYMAIYNAVFVKEGAIDAIFSGMKWHKKH